MVSHYCDSYTSSPVLFKINPSLHTFVPASPSNLLSIANMDHAIGFACRGISSTIAVTSEVVAHHKGRNKEPIVSTVGLITSRIEDSIPEDEENRVATECSLDSGDDAAVAPQHDEKAEEPPKSVEEVSQSFLNSHQHTLSPPLAFTPQPIPMPVLIPQRRPRDFDRGFIRAYPPMLGPCSGIEQSTFINFLNSFQSAAKASPVFDVINIACFGVGMVPSSICLAVSSTVGFANGFARELQIRYRANVFLDRVNESLFKPCGLFAVVMTYKPDMPDDAFLTADISNKNSPALFKTLSTDNSNLKKKLNRFRLSSGTVMDSSIPQCAPYIYPEIEVTLKSQNQSKLKMTSESVQEYLDRRAQASFTSENLNAKPALSLPPISKPFVSRFADPNHPVNSGSIFGLVSGGKFDPIAKSRVTRAEAKAKRKGEPPLTVEEKHDAYMGRLTRGRVSGTPSKTIPVIGKLLKKDVLYLMIVNLPSPDEMEEMRTAMEKA